MATQLITPVLPIAHHEDLWPAQGQWTYEDYLRLPDDGRRYEIIEGVLYVAGPSSFQHQFVVAELILHLHKLIADQKAGILLTGPFEVHLPGIAWPVQPDILFIPTERVPRSNAQFFTGAPDLIVEVLSPSSVRLDQVIKFGAYERAGVREYWIANPKTRTVTVFMLPAGGQEYVLLGQFGPGESLRSAVLPELEIATDSLFMPT
ncbi:MAG: Uma2 family endonuclease [Chloroflexota bacterium]